MRALLLAGVAVCATAGAVRAATLDRVRQANTLQCGAVAQAGMADAAEDGRITGLAVDLCRAAAIAVLGPAGQIAFHLYDSAKDFDPVRAGTDDLAFLSAATLAEQGLAGATVPGPAVFVTELTVMTPPGRPALGSGGVACFMAGLPPHQALEAWATRTHASIARIGFQELSEMHDAFDSGRCDAMADEAGELAEFRAEAPNRAGATIQPALGVMPVYAVTPVTDGAWAGLMGWTLAAIVQSEAEPNPWRSDPVVPGLRTGWAKDVVSVLGGYGDMLARNTGAGSKLGLPPRVNAPWPEGGLLPPGPR